VQNINPLIFSFVLLLASGPTQFNCRLSRATYASQVFYTLSSRFNLPSTPEFAFC